VEDKLKQGEALFAEGKIEEAEKYFLNVLEHDPQNKEVLNNLGVIAFQGQQIENAIDYFDKSLKIDPFYKEAVLNYVYILKELNLITEASSYLYKIIEANPNDKELKQLLNEIEIVQKPKIKLAVLCLPGLESFLGDILDFFQTKYEVRACYSNDNKEIESAVHWADIVWLEWANELAVYVTNNIRQIEKKFVVCRVHRYEVFSPFFCKIRWELVDTTIFVAKFMSVLSQRVVPDLDKKTNIRVVYNGIKLKKFKFRENAPGLNLAVVGYIHLRKNPTFWPHILSKLVKIDKRYTLHIAGEYQQVECKLYLEHIIKTLGLEDNVRFYGHQDNIHSWLENKNYLLSTSIHESFGYSIAEAMAMGIKPIIHRFPGSEELWPHHCIFNSIDEAVEMIQKKDDYKSEEYRNFIKNNYSSDLQFERLDKILSRNSKTAFDYSRYWNKRLKRDFSISGAGHIDYSPGLNEALYADRFYLLNHLIENSTFKGKSVLEIGPGIGQFTNYFFSHKDLNDYLGVDIAKVSVEELTKKFGKRFKFREGDFASSDILKSIGERKFDFIFAAAVLLHIVSDDGYSKFIENVSRGLKDGGIYIGMEPISFLPKEGIDKINMSPHNRMLRWDDLHQCLEENGLIVESLTPLFSIMNTPFDASRVNEIRADALNRLVVEITKTVNKNQDLIDTIRFIDKNLIAEHKTGLSEWVIVCRKGKAAKGKTLPKSVTFKPLLEQLCTSIEKRDRVIEVDHLMQCFETTGYDPGKLIENFMPYQKEYVEKFVSSGPIEPLTIKTEEIGNGTFHIDMLLQNSVGGQLFVQNLLYDPRRSFYISSAYDPLKTYLSNTVSEMKLTAGSQTKIKSYVFDEKLKKDILENELAYMWERAYPGTHFLHFNGLAIIARRYLFAQKYIEEKDVLEAASGFGYGAASFSRKAKTVEVLDIAKENIEFGEKTYGFNNISWQIGNVENLPFENSSFDVYVSFETIEHLRQKTIPIYLSEASRVLRTSGVFIISTPNRETREGRINNPYHLSEMYFEQFKEYLEKSFDEICYYSTKGLAIYFGAYPTWADGFVGICKKR